MFYWVIYLYDIGYDQVENDQHGQNPEANKKVLWTCIPNNISEHVAGDEPIVDNHDVE